MSKALVAQLITMLTPIVVPILVMYIKKLPLQPWTLPIIATVLGALADVLNQYATGGGVGILWGAVLGAAAVGVREIVDQLKQAVKGGEAP